MQLGVISAGKRSFPGADIGHWTADIESDHDLLTMTFRLCLNKPKHTKLRFDLERLKDPNVLQTLQAMTGGKFAPLAIMSNEDLHIESLITTFNTAATETASKIFSKHREQIYIYLSLIHI